MAAFQDCLWFDAPIRIQEGIPEAIEQSAVQGEEESASVVEAGRLDQGPRFELAFLQIVHQKPLGVLNTFGSTGGTRRPENDHHLF